MTNQEYKKQIEKLHQITVYGRWLVVLLCWLTLGIYGICGLKETISLAQEYFTWSAVRYGIIFHRLPSFALAFCIAITTSVLVWQSRNIIWGLPAREKYRLEQKVEEIMASGSRHPLWKWINK